MTTDPFETYFTARSAEVPVPSLGSAAVMERARRRRHRRNGAKLAAVVGVVALGGAVVAQRVDHADQEVASKAQAPATSLDWTVVQPPSGLGQGVASVTTDDGAVYELSTEPGAPVEGQRPGPRHLYRSTDGETWQDVALPDGMSALDVAGGGDQLYAVGTAPAGGGAEQVQLVNGTGDGSWSGLDVPLDLPALAAAFPGKVRAEATHVAVGPDGSLVVTVSVGAYLDQASLPAETAGKVWGATSEGIDVYDTPCVAAAEGDVEVITPTVPGEETATTVSEVPTTTPTTTPTSCAGSAEDFAVERSYSWAELGIDPAVGTLALGRTYVFAADADGPLAQVATLPAVPWTTQVVASPQGFWLAYSPQPSSSTATVEASKVLHSADGRSWDQEQAMDVAGYPTAVGVLQGQPALLTRQEPGGRASLHLLGTTSVQSTDVAEATGQTGDRTNALVAGFGPLGVALVLAPVSGGGSAEGAAVVHSADGTSWSSEDLPAAPDGVSESPRGVTVSADAVTVRLNGYPRGSMSGTPDGPDPVQRLFVGTPS